MMERALEQKDVIDDVEAIASMGYDVIKRLEKEG